MEFTLQAPQSEQLSFSGHETFVLRYGWLKKAYDAILIDPSVFGRDDAIVTLGVGKNMVRSIRHWALASGVIEEEPRTRGLRFLPSSFGNFLFGSTGHDLYLEDVGSIWLVHWKICTNERRSTTWAWTFNLLRSTEFTVPGLVALIQKELQKRNAKIPPVSTLKRDVDCCMQSYAASQSTKKTVIEDTLDSPLVELRLINRANADLSRFNRGPQVSLRDEIFTFALIDFWERTAPARESLSFNEIAYGVGSPGSIFKFDEDSLVTRLERLEWVSGGGLVYADVAGLKQVYKRATLNKDELLETYYGSVALV
jgi:hypothetical protein